MSVNVINFYSSIFNSIHQDDVSNLSCKKQIGKTKDMTEQGGNVSTDTKLAAKGTLQNTQVAASPFDSVMSLSTPPSYLFEDLSNQTYKGKEYPSLLGSNYTESEYWKNVWLVNPHYFKKHWTEYVEGIPYIYDKNGFDFSATCPTGKDLYPKLNDGGSHDRIAVIDCYDKNSSEEAMSVDDDDDVEMSHGEFVASLIESQANEYGLNYKVDRMDINLVDGVMSGGVEALDHIMENIDEYRAVNLSICEYCSYDTVSKALGVEVTPENLAEYKQIIMETVTSEDVTQAYEEWNVGSGQLPDLSEYVETGEMTEDEVDSLYALLTLRYKFEHVGEFYAKADKIAEYGVPVFMAAGNYDNMFNFGALLTSNVEYIGADADVNQYELDDMGFSVNSLVSRYGLESFAGTDVIDGKIDVDGNGTGDIDATGIDLNSFWVTGTSFASPWMLVQVLAQSDYYTAQQEQQKQQQQQEEYQKFLNSMNIFDYVRYCNNAQKYADHLIKVGNVSQKSANIQSSTQNYQNSSTALNSSSSNQSIVGNLDNQINYGTTGNKKSYNDMGYEELSAYFAAEMDAQVLNAGVYWATKGSGSTFRVSPSDVIANEDKYAGMSYKQIAEYMMNNPI